MLHYYILHLIFNNCVLLYWQVVKVYLVVYVVILFLCLSNKLI
nr:MAG TPA: hypothetical protein [Caudoviricetes sp.]DAO32111.1 MAG TPA: hypothetical protein [Caudoviricetes sp.]